MNLWDETIKCMDSLDKKIQDIEFISVHGKKIEICDMKEVFDVDYDPGYGTAYIPPSLTIVFEDNSWLERQSYDGSEWWTYKSPPVLEENAEVFSGNLRYDCDN